MRDVRDLVPVLIGLLVGACDSDAVINSRLQGDMFRLTAKKKQWWQVEGIGDDGSHGCKGYVPSRLMNPHVPDSEA